MSQNTNIKLPGLVDKRIAITAGANGIGLSIAQQLHAAGARIAICDIDSTALDTSKNQLDNCLAMQVDVADEASVDEFFTRIQKDLGGLDALVNNAGIAGPTDKIEDIDPADWRRCLDVCLTGQYLCARRAIPMIKKNGSGAIINMSSAAGKHGYAYRTPYSAAKFGVIGLTQSLAKELGPDNIRVNAICPGLVSGPRIEKVIEDRAAASGVSVEAMREDYLSKVSMRCMVGPDDVAATIAFLLSDAGKTISGQSLSVDGNVEVL